MTPPPVAEGASRRQARRAALVLLYQRDVLDQPFDRLRARYEEDTGTTFPAYGEELVRGVEAGREELDADIDAAARGWSADRISPIERAALRIAVLELRRPRADVPPAVAIDEAVRLAKRYASPEAATFVNGVLGAVARRLGVGR